MSDGTRGAPEGVDNEPPGYSGIPKECPFCGVQTNTLAKHIEKRCEVVGGES